MWHHSRLPEGSTHDFRLHFHSSLRSSRIQQLVMDKRKSLLRLAEHTDLDKHLTELTLANRGDVDENGDVVFEKDFAKLEQLLGQRYLADYEVQLSKQLRRVERLLGASTKVRVEDVEFLAERCPQVQTMFHDAFRHRHVNYAGWHQLSHILLLLSYLATVHQNQYLFTRLKLVGLLVETLPDLQSMSAHPEKTAVLETTIRTLLTLGNIAWHSPQIATELRTHDLAFALSRLTPLHQLEIGIVEGVAFLLSCYVQQVAALDHAADSPIFVIAEQCLRLDFLQYRSCVAHAFAAMPYVVGFAKDNPKWEALLQAAIIDSLQYFTDHIGDSDNADLLALFEDFAREVTDALAGPGPCDNPVLHTVVHSEHWGTLSVRILSAALHEDLRTVKPTTLNTIASLWRAMLSHVGESVLQVMPQQLIDLVVRVLVTHPAPDAALLHFLHTYFCQARFEDVGSTLSSHQHLVSRCLELVDPERLPNPAPEVVRAVLVLVRELAYLLSHELYDGPAPDSLFVLRGCCDSGVAVIKYYAEFGKKVSRMDLESTYSDLHPEGVMLDLQIWQKLATAILDHLSTRRDDQCEELCSY